MFPFALPCFDVSLQRASCALAHSRLRAFACVRGWGRACLPARCAHTGTPARARAFAPSRACVGGADQTCAKAREGDRLAVHTQAGFNGACYDCICDINIAYNIKVAATLQETRDNRMPLRIFSYGGGVQSVAVLVKQAQGELAEPFDYFVFANVGEDSENPATLAYHREVALPYAEQHGIRLVEVQKTRKGELDTVYQSTLRGRSISIPIVFPGRGHGNRSCTFDFKATTVAKWIKSQGVERAVIGIGFSTDEAYRIAKKHPDWHDHYMSRDKKKGIIP